MKHWSTLVAAAVLAACGTPEPRVRTVAEFVEDPAVLQGVMIRCNASREAAARDPECANALAAANRLAEQDGAQRAEERAAEFERQRAERRTREEQQRRAAEQSKPKFDPYSAPVGLDPGPDATPPGAAAKN